MNSIEAIETLSQVGKVNHPEKLPVRSSGRVKGVISAPTVEFKDISLAVSNLQQRLIDGATVRPQELIGYQIMLSQWNLKVEMVSKLAESVMSTVRRFQS